MCEKSLLKANGNDLHSKLFTTHFTHILRSTNDLIYSQFFARQFTQQQQYARRHFTCQKTAAGRRALLMCQPIRHHVTPLLLPQFTLPYLLTHFGCAFSMNKSPSVFIWALENYQALLWWKFRTGEFIREIAKLSFIVKGALIYDLIHCANILHVCACYSKGNAWIATKNR